MGRSIGRKHKAATANSRRKRTSQGGINISYGNGRVSSITIDGPTESAGLHDNIVHQPSDVDANISNPAPVIAVEVTRETLTPSTPTLTPESLATSNYLVPFANSTVRKTDSAVFASIHMTRNEYGEFLVNMGKHSALQLRLPNFQSTTILDQILVTLELSQDDYNVLLELKENNADESILVS